MDEVTPRPVRTKTSAVERATEFCFVLGVSRHAPKFLGPVRELAFVAVLAGSVLFERPAQLGLVPAGVGLDSCPPVRIAGASFQFLGLRGFHDVLTVVLAGQRRTAGAFPVVVGILLVDVVVVVVY